MSADQSQQNSQPPLRTIAMGMLLVGAAGSLAFMLYTGRRNPSLLLMLLFVGWVASPFAVSLLAIIRSKNWTADRTKKLFLFCILLSLLSLISYSGIFILPGTKPAFIFLMLPLLSWVIIGILYVVAFKR